MDTRARGSIMFFTTGILLATLEVDQALSNYTHIILDEVHERDCDIDLAMFMLKKVISVVILFELNKITIISVTSNNNEQRWNTLI